MYHSQVFLKVELRWVKKHGSITPGQQVPTELSEAAVCSQPVPLLTPQTVPANSAPPLRAV